MNFNFLKNEMNYRKQSKIKRFFLYLIPTIIVIGGSIIFIVFRFESRKQLYEKERLSTFQFKLYNSTQNLENFSNFIFTTLINTQEVINLMWDAWNSPPEDRKILRESLYSSLDSGYEYIKSFSFDHLHFHFPDSTSFLRMNDITFNGDILRTKRPSVRIVNQELEPLHGFGEGPSLIGYRFLYPLFCNDIHCGSVEIAFSIEGLLSSLYQADKQGIQFLFNKSLLEQTFSDKKIHTDYILSNISDKYVLEKKIQPAGTIFELSQTKQENVAKQLDIGKDFIIEAKHDNKSYLILFTPITNFVHTPIGWLVQYLQDEGLARIRRDYIILGVITSLMSILMEITIILAFNDRDRFKNLSAYDMLTGIINRQQLYLLTSKEIDKALRYGYPLSIILFDIDLFKSFNDSFGHSEGDRILSELSLLVNNSIRDSDIFGRWGGEEFIIVLPHNKIESAKKLAEKIRLLIAQTIFTSNQQVTISAGVTSYILDDTIETMFNRADRAMYEAKRKGRNCVCVQ